MMKGRRWFGIEGAIALASIALGWILPDGLNSLGGLLGESSLKVTPSDRLLAAMVVFVFVTSLRLIIAVREETRELRDTLPVSIRHLLDASILRLFLDGAGQNPEGMVSIERVVASTLALLTKGDPELLDARAVVIERAVADATHSIRDLCNAGIDLDILDNNEITTRLASTSSRYRQVQRKAYQVPGEWTQTWMRFVDDLGTRDISCEYVVLTDRESAIRDREKLASMHRYLSAHHWDFYYCDVKDVLDSLGGCLPTDFNVEIFDARLAKTQETPEGYYHGGIRLRVALYPLDDRTDFQRFNDAVTKHAQRYSPRLFSVR